MCIGQSGHYLFRTLYPPFWGTNDNCVGDLGSTCVMLWSAVEMGKLNVTVLRYLSKEDFRVLTSVIFHTVILRVYQKCNAVKYWTVYMYVYQYDVWFTSWGSTKVKEVFFHLWIFNWGAQRWHLISNLYYNPCYNIHHEN